ncbi:UNVERIFIED_CONTAM: hypothetical protein K2H54_051191 [Gekko kuhli]
MVARGHQQTAQECRAKAKDMHLKYNKAVTLNVQTPIVQPSKQAVMTRRVMVAMWKWLRQCIRSSPRLQCWHLSWPSPLLVLLVPALLLQCAIKPHLYQELQQLYHALLHDPQLLLMLFHCGPEETGQHISGETMEKNTRKPRHCLPGHQSEPRMQPHSTYQ